jgi:hypothetical protein
LQKINNVFASEFVARVLSPVVGRYVPGVRLHKLLPQSLQTTVGYSAAVLEAALGIGLLFSYRAYWGIVCLHVVILLCFGPLGRASFHGIWGWNVMCIYLALRGVHRDGGIGLPSAALS